MLLEFIGNFNLKRKGLVAAIIQIVCYVSFFTIAIFEGVRANELGNDLAFSADIEQADISQCVEQYLQEDVDHKQILEFSRKSPSSVDNSFVDNYYVRNESVNIEELTDKLKKHNIVAITGVAGSGKLQLAYYYAYKIFNNRLDQLSPSCQKNPCLVDPDGMGRQNVAVITIPCNTIEILKEQYRDFALNIGMRLDKDREHDAGEIVKMVQYYVKEQLDRKYRNIPFILIFAGCDAISYENLEKFIPKNLNPELQQVIITSRQIDFIDVEDKNLSIGGFTDNEAVDFLMTESNIKLDEAVKIAKLGKNLPFNLQSAKLYIKRMRISPEEYLDDLSNDEAFHRIKEEEMKLMRKLRFYNKPLGKVIEGYINNAVENFLKDGPSEGVWRYALAICSLFHPDNIPTTILKHLLSFKYDLGEVAAKVELRSFLLGLERYGFLLDRSDGSQSAPSKISINTVVHARAQDEMERLAGYQKQILDHVLEYFNKGDDPVWSEAEINTIPLFINPEHRLEIVRNILEQLGWRPRSDLPPLLYAIASNHPEIAKIFIESGEDVNKVDANKNTSLMRASEHGDLATAKLLINNGVKSYINRVNSDGKNAFMYAYASGNAELIDFLTANGAKKDINKKDKYGTTSLMEASANGHFAIVKSLVGSGAKINQEDNSGNTAFMMASANGHFEIADFLAEKGAYVDTKGRGGNTALMFVSEMGYVDILDLLVSKNVKLDETNKYGQTALIKASENEQFEVIKILLANGVKDSINVADKGGKTALAYAKENKNEAIVNLLVANGAKE